LVLASGHPQLSQIHVQGHLIKSNTSGIVTRSRSKVAPDQFSKISLSAKLLSLLADSLLEMQEQTTIATTYNDDEWEEVEDDDDGDEDVEEQAEAMVMKPSNGLSSVFQPLSDMQHLLTDEIEDGDYQEDPCAATDPLNQIVLSAYVTDFIKQFANRDKSTFHILCQVRDNTHCITLKFFASFSIQSIYSCVFVGNLPSMLRMLNPNPKL
jgi:hypothetical protein